METAHMASLCFMWGAIDFAFTERDRVSSGEAEMGFQTVQKHDES